MTAVPPLDREALKADIRSAVWSHCDRAGVVGPSLANVIEIAVAEFAARESALSAQHQQELADARQQGREDAAKAIEREPFSCYAEPRALAHRFVGLARGTQGAAAVNCQQKHPGRRHDEPATVRCGKPTRRWTGQKLDYVPCVGVPGHTGGCMTWEEKR